MADIGVNNQDKKHVCPSTAKVVRKPPHARRPPHSHRNKKTEKPACHEKCSFTNSENSSSMSDVWCVTSSYANASDKQFNRSKEKLAPNCSKVASNNSMSVNDLTENLMCLLELDSALNSHKNGAKSSKEHVPSNVQKKKFDVPTEEISHITINEGEGPLPYVFGYKSNKRIFGKEHDKDPGLPEFETEKGDSYHQNMPSDDLSKDFGSIPSTLKPLLPWLCKDLPRDLTGFDSKKCLSFLPSLLAEIKDLPCVPPPQDPSQPLPCSSIILPEKPWKPKKYSYCWPKSQFTECSNTANTKIKLYNKDGDLLFEQQNANRTCKVVRKEIEELERLIQGIGTDGSACLVVQFQADITKLKSMVDETNTLLQADIFQRNHKVMKDCSVDSKSVDHFGLREFYAEHDSVLRQIQRQHAICCQELALLEQQLDMTEKHFSTTYGIQT